MLVIEAADTYFNVINHFQTCELELSSIPFLYAVIPDHTGRFEAGFHISGSSANVFCGAGLLVPGPKMEHCYRGKD
jgi:hypothetical protein